MSRYSEDRAAELRELFFESAQEVLQSFNDEALKIEKQPGDLEAIRSLRRAVHTLKGDAATCGFIELSNLAHQFEDALAVEADVAGVSLAEIAFSAADTFALMLTAYRKETELPSTENLKSAISELANSQPNEKRHPEVRHNSTAAWTEYEKLVAENAQLQGRHVFQMIVIIDPLCAMPIAARQMIVMALNTLGEVLGTRPEPGSSEVSRHFQLLLATNSNEDAVGAKCRIPTVVSNVELRPLSRSMPQPAVEANLQPPQSASVIAVKQSGLNKDLSTKELASPIPALEDDGHEHHAALAASAEEREAAVHKASGRSGTENVLRVDAEKIDNVLNLVGELIIGKSMLQQAMNEFAERYPKELIRGKLADAMAFQSRVLNDLQRSVMKVRMVPVEQLFRRFPRMIRDLAKRCDKQVQLVVHGQNTDMDKGLLDAIAEPITHLVRNAISHGIETSEQRIRNHKPAHGTIHLNAYHQASQVIVEITDDGGGIDANKIRLKAVKQGIISAEEASRMSDSELLDLVFKPGFSTADVITDVSGRGVGLDVVRSVLTRLKGGVEIETQVGKGTTFRLKLPLTLAIIKALLFRVEQRLYAIPINAVAEIARARESDLHRVDNYEVLQLRNQVLPVMRLGRSQEVVPDGNSAKIFVLVLSLGERKLGLIVDALEGEEELVVKALDGHTIVTDLVSGASILGDGRVVLIMNLAAIVERFSKSRSVGHAGASSGLLLSYSERTQTATAAAVSR
ncbi:MAG: two-component system, chemotaxis family, sensor kinase CheA [Acidobacteriaceae bacterium]